MLELAAPRDRLAIALDVPDLARARDLIAALAGIPGWLKVGAELFTAAGPPALAEAAAAAKVFLDTKIHDIPNTAAAAVAAATRCGVSMLTLHIAGGRAMLRAAREAAEESASARGIDPPLLLGVTVLTSLSGPDLKELGFSAGSVDAQVGRLVDLALDAGLDGVVASPLEAAAIRHRVGPSLGIVTPGVRPERNANEPNIGGGDDQARTATPAAAIAAGADVLVVGRPVVRASDPAAAARELVRQIEAGLGEASA